MTTATATGRPQPVPVDPAGIPDDLKALPQWVVWRYVEEIDPETGEVDWDKPPRNARTDGLASSTKPRTWSTFAKALAAYERGGLDGVGFVLHRKKGEDGKEEHGGLVGVDLDHCREPATGEIDDWAMKIVRELNTYAEVSPSGTGVRLFLYGDLPTHGRKKGPYENYQSRHYVTVTGRHVEGAPLTIEHRQEQLLRVHAGIFGDGKPATNGQSAGWRPPTLDDAELVRRAEQAKNGAKFSRLWRGELAGHGSASEADLALCNYLAFWCGPDESRIADLFAQSGLYRSKWNREDYRRRTIGKALAGRTDFYGSRRNDNATVGRAGPSARVNGNGHRNTPDDSAGNEKVGPAGAEKDVAHLTDRGNAIRFVREHGRDLRHVHPWRKWLCWGGGRWRADDEGAVTLRSKRMIAALFRGAVKEIQEVQSVLEAMADDDADDET